MSICFACFSSLFPLLPLHVFLSCKWPCVRTVRTRRLCFSFFVCLFVFYLVFTLLSFSLLYERPRTHTDARNRRSHLLL